MRGDYPYPTQVIRKLSVKWSDELADYKYTLTVLHEYDNGERRVEKIVTGDKKWAKNNANHYSLLMPKEEKND